MVLFVCRQAHLKDKVCGSHSRICIGKSNLQKFWTLIHNEITEVYFSCIFNLVFFDRFFFNQK